MATVNGTSGNDFIHVAGDGLVAPAGYTDNPGATIGNDTITPGTGNDYVYAGAGDDEIDLNPGDLTSGDTIDGGSGNDVLYLLNTGTSALTLDTTAFANVSHIEGIIVPPRYHGATTTIDLTDALVGSSDDSHRLTVYLYNEHTPDYVNIATVDASAVTTSTNSVTFIVAPYGTQSGSSFTLTGGAGADNFILDAGSDGTPSLAGTAVNGGTGSSLDTLQIAYNDATSASALANVSHIEVVSLTGGGTNSIVLPDALVSSADDSKLLTVNGGAGNDTIDASLVTTSGNHLTLLGGAGTDTFKFTAGNFNSGDTVNGGSDGSIDTLVFATAGTLAASAFANVSHIEALQLADGLNNVTLTDSMVSSADDGRLLTVYGGSGIDTINLSAITTASNSFAIHAGSGGDTIYVVPGELTASDAVDGGAGLDTLYLDDSGSSGGSVLFPASAFANVSHVEMLIIPPRFGSVPASPTIVTLSDALVSSSDNNQTLTIYFEGESLDQKNNQVVDGSGVTSASNSLLFNVAGLGTFNLIGGAGADTFQFSTDTRFGGPTLSSSVTLNGSTGSSLDSILLSYSGAVAASAFGNASHIEVVTLANFGTNSVAIPDALVSTADDGKLLTVNGGAGNDTVDASQVTTAGNHIAFLGGAGADTLTFSPSNFNSTDSFNGGSDSSIDTLAFASPGTIDASVFANISHVEAIRLANGTNSISIPDALVGSADDGHELTIHGGTGNDTVDASAVTSAANGVVFDADGGYDVFKGGAGTNTLDLSNETSAIWFGHNDPTGIEVWTKDNTDYSQPGTERPLVDSSNVQNVIGTPYSDVITGDTGNNTYTYTGGFDTFSGGGGNDTLDLSRTGHAIWFGYNDPSGIEAWTKDNSDISQSGTWRAIVDTSNVENVIGTPYNDQINGDDNNNTYTYTGGLDTFNGGGGSDTLDLSHVSRGIWFGHSDPSGIEAWSFDDSNDGYVLWSPLVDTTSVENVIGTPFNDQVYGDNSDNTYTYTGGFDIFDGGGGTNTIDLSRMTSAIWYGHNDPSGIEAFTKGNSDYSLPGTDSALVNTTNVQNVIGTAYNDQITGDAGANQITGGGGADLLVGGGGGDTFVYTSTADSTGSGYDTIVGFDTTSDRIDLPGAVTGIDAAISSGSLSSASIDSDLAAAIGSSQMASHHAVLFTPTSGDLAGQNFLIVDANGTAGYQAGQDFVIGLHSGNLAGLNTGDFI